MRGQRLGTVGIRIGLCSSRFSQHGSPLSHLNNNLLHLHMMNTTMNSQQPKTVQTDISSMMISLQHNNLILRPNLKPKTTSHSQKQTHLPPSGLSSPLSIDDLFRRLEFKNQACSQRFLEPQLWIPNSHVRVD